MHVHSADLLELREIGFTSDAFQALNAKLHGVFHQDPNARFIRPLLSFLLRGEDFSNCTELRADENERCYLDHLFNLPLLLGGRSKKLGYRRSVLCASERYDFLCSNLDTEWSLIRTLNYLMLGSMSPTKSVAVITSARNEGINLVDWISHYRALGADSIIIYSNDNDDHSDRLLRLLSSHGVIILVENDTRPQHNIQHKVFNHALSFLPELWDHEWCLFVDLDEFMVPGDGIRLLSDFTSSLQNSRSGRSTAGSCLNWKWFGSYAQLERTPGLVVERFQHSSPNRHVKTLARIRDVTGIRTAHLPRLIHGGILVDGNFEELINPMNEIGPAYTYGQINHYWNKSFQEFLVKQSRGGGMTFEPHNYSKFFEWGNRRNGTLDPLPRWLLEAIRSERQALLNLPEVQRGMEQVDNGFAEILASLAAEVDIHKVYSDASARARSLLPDAVV